MKTKTDFLEAYRAALVARYGNVWAGDARRLNRFVAYAELTLSTPDSDAAWNHRGEAVDDAAKAVGLKARPSLSTLRALPDPTEGFWVHSVEGEPVVTPIVPGEKRPEGSIWAQNRALAAVECRRMAGDWRVE